MEKQSGASICHMVSDNTEMLMLSWGQPKLPGKWYLTKAYRLKEQQNGEKLGGQRRHF